MDVRRFKPITKTCVEETCGKDFVVTEGEQAFYASKDLIPRRRCHECIDRRKAKLNTIDRPDVRDVSK